jgi:hypothetical protein
MWRRENSWLYQDSNFNPSACSQSLSILHYLDSYEHLDIVPISNYSAVTNSRTMQFTPASTVSSQSAVSSPMSSASMLTITTNCLLFWLPSQDSSVLTPVLAGISHQPSPLLHQLFQAESLLTDYPLTCPACNILAQTAQKRISQQSSYCCVCDHCGSYLATAVVYSAVT